MKEALEKIREITLEDTKTIDERLEAVFPIKDKEGLTTAETAEFYRLLIDMIKREEAEATHIRELMQLYVLLAEAYVKDENYRPLDELAFDVRETLRDTRIAWEVLKETMPRFIDAMEDTVFHHETYMLLLVYLNAAYKNDSLDEDMKGYARHFLKLRILLDDPTGWGSNLLGKDFEDALARLFTQEELVKIIMRPTIGSLRCDPVEYSRRWEEIYYDVEDRLEERFANAPRHHGFCFIYWEAKRELLKDEYGIEWHSPSQMNPRVMFD